MKHPEPTVIFNQERASFYDNRFAKLSPTRDSLHMLIRIILSELPKNARILCVGAGTGAELVDLAQSFPQWTFTAVDPAIPMLNICRAKVEEFGFTSRCIFHEGYLDSLPASDPFDAATSLLVSHFIMKPNERRDFFGQIASRLRPHGHLISSDVVSDMSTPAYRSLLEVWKNMLKSADIPGEEVDKLCDSYGCAVAVLPVREVEAIIEAGGFAPPILFFQNLLIHAWFSRRA